MGKTNDTEGSVARRHDSRGAVYLLFTVLFGVAGFLVWALTSEIDEIARGQGEVIAVARTQEVQVTDGGVLERLFVAEGDTVRKGALLARLDATRAAASYQESRSRVALLQAMQARLKAEVLGDQMVFPRLLESYPAFVREQTLLYRRRKKSFEDKLDSLQEKLAVIERELGVVQPLLDEGAIGLSEVLRLERERADVRIQLTEVHSRFLETAQDSLAAVEEKLASEEEKMRAVTYTLAQTKIVAPRDGVINRIYFHTLGAELRSGEKLLDILPTDSDLIVEAKFSPRDVAALKIGQTAEVKFDAYDASIYGAVPGEVVYISPDTLVQRDARRGEVPYYRVHVQIDRDWLLQATGRASEIRLVAGMTCNVGVRTGKRTVAKYLAKPVIKTLDNAFGER